MRRFRDVDDYIEALPEPARTALENLRKIILHAAPQAEEVIHYNMPALWTARLSIPTCAMNNKIVLAVFDGEFTIKRLCVKGKSVTSCSRTTSTSQSL